MGELESKIVATGAVVIGIALIVWRARGARAVGAWQEYGMHLRYGPTEIRVVEAALMVVGIGSIVMGVLLWAGLGTRK